VVRVDLDLLAQPTHRHPHVGRIGVLRLRPAACEERLGRDGLAEVRRERVEEPGFGRGQLDRLADDGRLSPVEVEGQVLAEHEALARDPVAEPFEDPVDPGAELGVVVGLGDVVLRDLLEEIGLGVAGVDRGEDDDRQVRLALDLARQGQPVHPGHHHVDDQEVGPAAPKPAERLVAVPSGLDVEAVAPQLIGEEDEEARIVVDDQDSGRFVAARAGAQHRGLAMARG
jgi:hypothetical protein